MQHYRLADQLVQLSRHRRAFCEIKTSSTTLLSVLPCALSVYVVDDHSVYGPHLLSSLLATNSAQASIQSAVTSSIGGKIFEDESDN